jgi:uncharacterized protein (TIGR02246 family)
MMYAVFAAAALVAVPAFAHESPKALQDAFTAAIIAEDAEALANLYTEDADSYDPSGGVQKGRAEILANWKGFFDAYDGFAASLDQKGEHPASETSHAAWGLWTMSAKPAAGGDAQTWKGRFLDVSVKTKHGWRYIVDHASMLASPATTEESATE